MIIYMVLTLILILIGFNGVAMLMYNHLISDDYYIPTPKRIKEYCIINWFGVIVIYILYFIVAPISALIGIFFDLIKIGVNKK